MTNISSRNSLKNLNHYMIRTLSWLIRSRDRDRDGDILVELNQKLEIKKKENLITIKIEVLTVPKCKAKRKD
jgi:hypothetical protein